MKIVVAIDSFKGSATSDELNQAVKKGILGVDEKAQIECFSIADGGEGTMNAIENALGGTYQLVETVDLLERPMKAKYLLTDKIAVVEVAEVVGIDKITPNEETVQIATTKGLAPLLLDAKKKGAKEIILTLGGTGTSDGGLGLLVAMGAKIDGFKVDLTNLIDFSDVKISALADVSNVYYGKDGYAYVFCKQKGGTIEIIEKQNVQAKKIAETIYEDYQVDLQGIKGTGAAGGLGAAVVLLGGSIQAGFPKVAKITHLEQAISEADLVITGEGKMDFQTLNGKVPFGVASLAKKYQKPCIALCGSLGEDLGDLEKEFTGIFSIQTRPVSLELAMKKETTLKNIEFVVRNIYKTLRG